MLSDSYVDGAIATLEAQFRTRRTRVGQSLWAVGRFWLGGLARVGWALGPCAFQQQHLEDPGSGR